MKQQTAVEYLVDQLLPKALTAEQYYHIEQDKEMEKEQIIDAWDNGCEDDGIIDNAEQYYNETFKSE